MPEYEIESTDRISRRVGQNDDKANKFYVHLFYEDIQNILPYHTRQNLKYTVAIKPSDENGFTLLANLFHKPSAIFSVNARERDFIYSIEHFVRRTGANLAYFGQLYWEINTLKLKVADKTTTLRCLDAIPGKVIKHGVFYRQLIPRSEHQVSDSFVDIPVDKVWSLELPEQLGRPSKQRQIIQELANLSDTLPRFASDELSRGVMNREFDLKKYSHDQFANMTKLMHLWGWMMKQHQEKETTEYYWVHQRLRFYSSLTLLREEILIQMNKLLRQLKIPYEIAIQGLPSEDEVKSYIDGMKQGRITFNEALEFIRRV